jgi:hypothetical protein
MEGLQALPATSRGAAVLSRAACPSMYCRRGAPRLRSLIAVKVAFV